MSDVNKSIEELHMGLKCLVFTIFMDQSFILTSYVRFSEDIWTSLISVDRLGLRVVIVYVGVSIVLYLCARYTTRGHG